jgi:hypothetical protein
MAPNPATQQLQITVSDETPVRSYAIFDISGRMVRNVADINSTEFLVKRESLQNGMYIIRMQFDGGLLSKKVIFE